MIFDTVHCTKLRTSSCIVPIYHLAMVDGRGFTYVNYDTYLEADACGKLLRFVDNNWFFFMLNLVCTRI